MSTDHATEVLFDQVVAGLASELDRVSIDPLIARVPAAERERILALEGAGVGLDGRKLVVTEALDVLDVLREAVALLRDAARLQHQTQQLLQQEFAFVHDLPKNPKPKRRSHYGPLNPLHRTWRGFALDLQQLEASARREQLRLTRANICRFGVDCPKTIERTMRWYGLAPTDWPPSTWPSTPPPRQ